MITKNRNYRAIAQVLSDQVADVATYWSSIDPKEFRDACVENGVSALVHHKLSQIPELASASDELLNVLRNDATRAVIFESQHVQLLGRVGDRLAAAGIEPLIFKGSALAYQVYAQPFVRERCDTDMLFPDKEVAQAALDILTADLGFQSHITAGGSLISYEKAAYTTDAVGLHHELDLHWQISNNNIYGHALTYEELLKRSTTIELGSHTFHAPCMSDALLIACLHRMANMAEGNADKLAWLNDMRLISTKLSDQEWSAVVENAIDKQVAHTVLGGLDACEAAFSQKTSDTWHRILARASADETVPSLFLESETGNLIGNVMALPSWRLRLLSALQVLFPPLTFMKSKYGFRNNVVAPYFYALRFVTGAWKALFART